MAWLKKEGDYWWMVEKVKHFLKNEDGSQKMDANGQPAFKWKNRERSTGLKDKYAADKYCADYNEDQARIKKGLTPLNREASRQSNWWTNFKTKALDHASSSMGSYSQQRIQFLLDVMDDLFSPQDMTLEEFKKASIGAKYVQKRLAGEPKTRWCGTKNLVNRPVMISTIRTEISFLSPLFEKAVDEWEDIGITKNPFKRLRVAVQDGVKEEKDDPKYLAPAILGAFFEECRRRHGPRFELMAEMFYYAGLRLNECRTIRIEDISLETDTLRIRGTKTAKAKRVVQLPGHFMVKVEAVVKSSAPGFLFHHGPGNGMIPTSTIQQRFKRCFRAVGAPWAHAHTLRHCYTSHRLENGDNMVAVRDAVGHESLATTSRYAHRGGQKQQVTLPAPQRPPMGDSQAA